MEKIVEQGLLYDFYGELLTEHQQQIYEGVVYDNLSLGEIAQEQDIIKRCDKLLQGYEEKLQLVSKFTRIKEKISQINQLSQAYEQEGRSVEQGTYTRQIRQLSDEILQQL